METKGKRNKVINIIFYVLTHECRARLGSSIRSVARRCLGYDCDG